MPPKAPTSIPSKSADATGLLLGEGGGGLWEGLGSGPSWHRAGVGESQLPGALFPTGFCSLEEVTSLPECPSVSSKQPPGHGCWGGGQRLGGTGLGTEGGESSNAEWWPGCSSPVAVTASPTSCLRWASLVPPVHCRPSAASKGLIKIPRLSIPLQVPAGD